MVYQLMEAIRLKRAARKASEMQRQLLEERPEQVETHRRRILDCEMIPARTVLIGEERRDFCRVTAYCGLDYSSVESHSQ